MSKPKWEPLKKQLPKEPTTPTSNTHAPSFEENFKIFLRIKPVTAQPRTDSLRITSNKEVEIIPPYYSTQLERNFQYEQVFGQSATNLQVFERTMQEPIRNVLAGFNSTVFIYGMTGAGKTYTMFNSEAQHQGVVGLTLDRLFEQIHIDQHSEYQVILSFFEIYNENIKDLLSESSQQLTIMEDPVKGVFINELKEVSVETALQAKATILDSLARRSNNATRNNQYSSRSHAILQFTIRKFHPHQQHQVAVSESKLFLIDLAGNEKAGQNESKRFVEGVNINKSLLTLGKCINILSQQKRPAFIPFRDSKLTRILKDSLGGNSKTVMIACVSPEARFYEETLNTLKYSTKARRIKNKGKAASIKLINRRELPSYQTVHRCDTDAEDQEERLYQLITRLQHIIEEKVRVEHMREELEDCYFENENELSSSGNAEHCTATMKEINELIPKLNHKSTIIENTIEDEIKKFIAESTKSKDSIYKQEIVSCKLKLKEQNKELQEMKKIIAEQKARLEGQAQSNPKINSNNQPESNSSHSISLTLPHEPQPTFKNSTPILSEKYTLSNQSHILIHESSGKSEEKSKSVLNIEIATSKNSSNKENVYFLNDHKRSNTPQSSLHSSKILRADADRANRKQPIKPTINITMENIKLKPPNLKIQSKQPLPETLITKESADLAKDAREDFLLRLREMDKNMHRLSKEQLKAMVEEYESGNYEVNKMQMSMINKLKFMARANDKSLPKEAHPRKDRSLIK